MLPADFFLGKKRGPKKVLPEAKGKSQGLIKSLLQMIADNLIGAVLDN